VGLPNAALGAIGDAMRQYFVYMALCADATYYVGITNDPDRRLWEHNAGLSPFAYTHSRRPVSLVYVATFDRVEEAIAWEKQVKGWSHAKKRALMNSNWNLVRSLASRHGESEPSR
jgi:putative endonuclease